MHLKIGKETKQGYTRVVSSASSADCYSYGSSALMALEFLRLSKSNETGVLMGFCISALRQLIFAKIKRNPETPDRLPLGTLLWGRSSTVPPHISAHRHLKGAVGSLLNVIKIWPKHAKQKKQESDKKASR